MRSMRILLIGFMSIILSGCATYSSNSLSDPSDPWQAANKPIFAMNDAIDSVLFKPLAKGYNAVTPKPIQAGVTNFFSNLNEIDNAINNLFQGKPKQFATSIGRLTVNTTIGIGGIFDVASYGQENDHFRCRFKTQRENPFLMQHAMTPLEGVA